MKRILLVLTAVAAMFTACTQDQEDFFPDSSANRADKTISDDVEILTSAPHGWSMKYFPSKTQAYGGYNFVVSFGKDGKVTFSGEADIAGSTDKKATSLYSVSQSAGIMLSFDGYNEIFSRMADPSAPIAGSSGEGMGGDNDFSILSACKDSVVLKGRTSGNRAVMYPMESDDWKGYLDALAAVDNEMFANSYTMTIGDNTFSLVADMRGLSLTYTEDGNYVTTSTSYIITDEGMVFYKPFEFDGKKISGFKLDHDGDKKFVSMEDPDIILSIDPLNKQFVNGLWGVKKEDMGTFAQRYWNRLRSGTEGEGHDVVLTAFGSFNYDFGFVFQSYIDDDVIVGQIYFDYTLVGDDEIDLTCRLDGDQYGSYFMSLYKDGAVPFGYNQTFRFKLVSDNIKEYMDMQCLTRSDNDIHLTKTFTAYPLLSPEEREAKLNGY